MEKSKLLILLHSFSPKEIKSFSQFIASPFFNHSKEITKFWKYLRKLYPDFPAAKISKQCIFRKLYPEQLYEDKQMRYLMSNLLKLGEQFLLVKNIKKGGNEVSLQLLSEFNDRKLNRHYNQLKNRLNANALPNKISRLDHLRDKITLADIEQLHFAQQNSRQYDDKIQYASDNLNRFFVLKKLKYACGMLNSQTFLKGTYELGLPGNWMIWLTKNNFWEDTVIKMYTNVFLAFTHQNKTSYFEELYQLLNKDTSEIPQQDLEDLFLYTINYCARKTRKGESEYIEIALNLYTKGIKENILLKNGFLSPWTFDNVVKIALRLKRYDWIENFIQNHKNLLPPDMQENTMTYNLAELHCYKKDYDKALTFLFKVKFTDMVHQLGSRIMLSKIYYELEEKEALLSLLNAFNIFLKRNKKISNTIRQTCLNFCELMLLITRGKVKKAEEKSKNTTLLPDMTWLLEKISALKAKKTKQ